MIETGPNSLLLFGPLRSALSAAPAFRSLKLHEFMSKQISQTLRESPLFKHLSKGELERVVAIGSVKKFADSQTIIEENNPVDYLYIVLRGRVRVWTTGPRGEVELKELGRGAYFGEVSLMSGNTATASVEVSQGPAKLVALERQPLLEFIQSDERLRKMLQGVTLARAKDTIGKVFK